MDFEIPDPLKAEHEELHAELRAAIDSGVRSETPQKQSPSCSIRIL